MEVDGIGRVAGRLRLDRGMLPPGTDLAVAAAELSLKLMSHRADGSGSIDLGVTADKPEELNLALRFNALNAFHENDRRPLFSGEGVPRVSSIDSNVMVCFMRALGVGKLKVLLKIRDGKRNFDILRARKTFDDYSPSPVQ